MLRWQLHLQVKTNTQLQLNTKFLKKQLLLEKQFHLQVNRTMRPQLDARLLKKQLLLRKQLHLQVKTHMQLQLDTELLKKQLLLGKQLRSVLLAFAKQCSHVQCWLSAHKLFQNNAWQTPTPHQQMQFFAGLCVPSQGPRCLRQPYRLTGNSYAAKARRATRTSDARS
jgi:hypothetical protein